MRSWIIPCGLAVLTLPVPPAQAFDCGQARAPIEKAICADPAAKASDAGMEAAFEALRENADPAQRQVILDDQRAWLKERNTACAADDRPSACVLKRNEKRTAFLTARPASGPGPEQPLIPVFVRQAGSRTKIELGLELFRFALPRTPGERTLDAQVDKVVSGAPRVKDTPDEYPWSREEHWRIAYASPAFLSIIRDSYEYSGGAHGMSGTRGLNIDMASGRVLAFADLFDKAGAEALDKFCIAKIKAEKTERGAGEDDVTDLPKAVREVVGDLANWAFKEHEASVFFDPYAVGAYAEGPYECTVPIDTVNRLAKRPIPLR